MDFSYSEEQSDVRKLARQIFEDISSNDRLREVEAGEERFDELLWKALAEAGLLGVAIEEAHGGMGFGFETLCLLIEEAGRSVGAVPLIPALVSAALPLQAYGSEAQKERWLGPLAAGEVLLSAALIEAGCEDPLAPQVQAQQTDGGWLLAGEKNCVPFAARAARVLLAAQTHTGIGLFLLDPKAEGVQLGRQESTAGETQYSVELRDVRVGAEELLIDGPAGAEALAWLVDRSAAATCAMAVGIVERMVRMTAEYTTQREQFGVPIASFQAVGQRAADCYIDLECLWAVTQQAVSLLDRGRPAAEEVGVARIWAGDVTHRVSHAAQHLHGGIGVDRDYPLFRYCLWAKQLELTLGGTAPRLAALGANIAEAYRAEVAGV